MNPSQSRRREGLTERAVAHVQKVGLIIIPLCAVDALNVSVAANHGNSLHALDTCLAKAGKTLGVSCLMLDRPTSSHGSA